MGNCKECTYYDGSNSHEGTGYCYMIGDYIGVNDFCEFFAEEFEIQEFDAND